MDEIQEVAPGDTDHRYLPADMLRRPDEGYGDLPKPCGEKVGLAQDGGTLT